MNYLFAMAPQGGDAGGGSMMSTFIMFALIFGIMYFMMIRPQQKRMKERNKMLSEIQKGAKIITNGGLHATVVGVEEKTLLIDLGNNIKVTIERQSVTTVVSN